MLPSAKHTSFSAGGGEPTIQPSRLGSLSQALAIDGDGSGDRVVVMVRWAS